MSALRYRKALALALLNLSGGQTLTDRDSSETDCALSAATSLLCVGISSPVVTFPCTREASW